MLRILVAAGLLAMVGAAGVRAEDWTNYPVTSGFVTYEDTPGHFVTVPKTALFGTESIVAFCRNDPTGEFTACANGSDTETGSIPITAFARSDRLDAVANSVSALSAQIADVGAVIAGIQANAIDFREQVQGEMAASTSLVVLTPSAPGKTTMHLGYGHFGDQGAVGFTAAHRLDTSLPLTIDGGISVTSSSDVVARAGVGIEF